MSAFGMVEWFFLGVQVVGTTGVIGTLSVNSVLIHGLPAVRAHKIVLSELICILIHKFSPLIHFLSCLLIEFLLVTVITLFQFLAHLVNSVVLLLAKHSQGIIVLIQQLSLSKLSGQVAGVNVDVDLETFSYCVFNVFVKLAEMLEEGNFVVAVSNLFHEHQDLVDTSQVSLHFADVMLEHCVLDSLG